MIFLTEIHFLIFSQNKRWRREMKQNEFLDYLNNYFNNYPYNLDEIKICLVILDQDYYFTCNNTQLNVNISNIVSWLNGFLSHPNNKNLSKSCITNYLSFSFLDSKYGFTLTKKE